MTRLGLEYVGTLDLLLLSEDQLWRLKCQPDNDWYSFLHFVSTALITP